MFLFSSLDCRTTTSMLWQAGCMSVFLFILSCGRLPWNPIVIACAEVFTEVTETANEGTLCALVAGRIGARQCTSNRVCFFFEALLMFECKYDIMSTLPGRLLSQMYDVMSCGLCWADVMSLWTVESHRQKWPFADWQNVADKILAKKILILLFGAATGKMSGGRGRWQPLSGSTVVRSHWSWEKKLNSSRVCLVKGNKQRESSQPCVKGWPHKGDHLAFLVALFTNFTDWSCLELLTFLALCKDLSFSIRNRCCRKFASGFLEKIMCSEVLDFRWSDNGCVFSVAAAV